MSDDKMHDLTTSILVEIRDELREHRTILKEHSGILKEHGERLDHLEQNSVQQGVTLRQILRAVEHGTEVRDK